MGEELGEGNLNRRKRAGVNKNKRRWERRFERGEGGMGQLEEKI